MKNQEDTNLRSNRVQWCSLDIPSVSQTAHSTVGAAELEEDNMKQQKG